MSKARKGSKQNGKEDSKAKPTESASAAETKFFLRNGVLSDIPFSSINLRKPLPTWTLPNGTTTQLHPIVVGDAEDPNAHLLTCRTPYLHTGSGLNAKSFENGRLSETLSVQFAGKPETPDHRPNPIEPFFATVQELDLRMKELAREHKILGEDMEDSAYEQCYKPLIFIPQGDDVDPFMSFGLVSLMKKRQWALWDENKKLVADEKKITATLYDRIIRVDFSIINLCVRKEGGRLTYTARPTATDILSTSDAYNADFKKSRTIDPEKCPF